MRGTQTPVLGGGALSGRWLLGSIMIYIFPKHFCKSRFDQREVSAPSPPPFRSSRASSSVQSPEPHFSSSSAYLPPTWAPPPVTKVIRINQQSLSIATPSCTCTKPISPACPVPWGSPHLPCLPPAPPSWQHSYRISASPALSHH